MALYINLGCESSSLLLLMMTNCIIKSSLRAYLEVVSGEHSSLYTYGALNEEHDTLPAHWYAENILEINGVTDVTARPLSCPMMKYILNVIKSIIFIVVVGNYNNY